MRFDGTRLTYLVSLLLFHCAVYSATLVVEGNVRIESLRVTGALIIRAGAGANVTVRNLEVGRLCWCTLSSLSLLLAPVFFFW